MPGPRKASEEVMDWNNDEFEFEKDIEIDVDTEIDFDTEVNLEVDKDVDVDIKVETEVEGNSAFLTADVEAIGKDTFVEVDTSVLAVEDQLSSVVIVGAAVVD